MLPKVVVFDLGKVLVDFDYGIAARRIAERGRISPAEVQKLIDHSPLLFRLETGEITNEQFFEAIRGATGFLGDFDEFCGFFADIFTPIAPMLELHAHLRARRVPIFIFSNTNGIAISHIRRNFAFFANFDGYIYSYQQGAMKPDPKVYEAVERITGENGKSILFLDDRKENVATAHERGWQAIHHSSPPETAVAFRHLNLLGETD